MHSVPNGIDIEIIAKEITNKKIRSQGKIRNSEKTKTDI